MAAWGLLAELFYSLNKTELRDKCGLSKHHVSHTSRLRCNALY